MTLISKLLAATALVAALAAPAMAFDANAGVGITLHDNNSHNGGPDTSGIDQSLEGTASTTGNANVAAVTDESAQQFLGKSVISADGQVIGTVSQARANADGGTEIVVALADGIQADSRVFSLDLAADVSADADLKLGWTAAELTANISAQASESNG